MSINMSLWKVENGNLNNVVKAALDKEEKLENWIEKDSSILGINLLLVGRQVSTPFGGRIDLLAIDGEGDVVIVELKRDKTPREIIAQILDYAAWIDKLSPKEIEQISTPYLKKSLSAAFSEHFGISFPEVINNDHKMLIVASELDDCSERIVQYLSEKYGVNINCVFFNYFKEGGNEYLGRSWLMDQDEVIERSESKTKVAWSGYWFVNLGILNDKRNWEDNRKYGFFTAGQGLKYSEPLKKLNVGDKVFGYIKGQGYVGHGVVTKEASMVKDFVPVGFDKPLLELPIERDGIARNKDNPELADWAVGVEWKKTYDENNAQWFKGAFANQNIVCKLRDKATSEFLLERFEVNE